jgi:dolichol-phosphate mannosyltransferase
MKLSVIIPLYNEDLQVIDLLTRIEAVPIDKEIIIVDDGSTNAATGAIAAQLEHRNVIFLRHDANRGKGSAVRTGLGCATGDAVIIQDADQEYYPEDYPALLRTYVENEAEVVYGVRDLSGRSAHMRYGNLGLTLLTNLLYRGRLHDMETCYKLIDRQLFTSLGLECRRFDIEAEITAKLLLLKKKIIEVPIRYEPRQEGKKLTVWDGFPAVKALLKYWSWKPGVVLGGKETPGC